MLDRQMALQLIDRYVSSARKKRHMTAVSAIMRELAKQLKMNEQEWELAGLLHDLDYDIIDGDMTKHGLVGSEMLKGRLPEESLHAVQSHDYRTGVKPESIFDKALIASDCFWGLIVPVALSSFQGKIKAITLDALVNAFKDESFPRFLKNGMMICTEFGLTLDDFLKIALRAMPSYLIISVDDL